jgi:hypothetical protein
VAATDTGTVGYAAAKVGNGREGDIGAGDKLTTDIAGLGSGSVHTLEGFVRPDNTGSVYTGIFGSRHVGRSLYLNVSGAGLWHFGVGDQEGQFPGGGPTLGNWYHVALVADGTNGRLYVNGTALGSPVAYTWTAENTIALLLLANQYASYSLDGVLDEVRYSQVARSPAWIKFEIANVVAAGNEQSWGPEQLVTPAVWQAAAREVFSPGAAAGGARVAGAAPACCFHPGAVLGATHAGSG